MPPMQESRVRRRNHSCDQCRKSKRACDALYLDLTRRESLINADDQRSPCSYCARTRKRCTMVWARSQTQPVPNLFRQHSPSKRLCQSVASPWKVNELQKETEPRTWDHLLERNPTPWEPFSVDKSGSVFDYDSMLLSPTVYKEPMQQAKSDAVTSAIFQSDLLLSELSETSDTNTQQASNLELDTMWDPIWSERLVTQGSQTYESLQPCTSKSPRRLSKSTGTPYNQQFARWNAPQSSLSPFSIEHKMMTASNNHLTSANLLQIYHDVLEHNLSCWLTEITCPYQPRSTDRIHVATEWGSSWTNRMYERTVKLDCVAQSCKLLNLTRSEDQAASRALHLAIMAFATQWAQGSHRHREKYPYDAIDHGEDEVQDGITEEFDRVLQNNFWDQAQRALQKVSDLESYRVACAELIFALTQKPQNHYTQSHKPGREFERDFTTESVLSQVQNIIRKEGPPAYMERAARKMHALKYRWDALEKGLGSLCNSQENDTNGVAAINYEDRATIGLLYWFAIMFDTVSSSMNERPVVVLDQDCELDREEDNQQIASIKRCSGNGRWDFDLFMKGSLENTHQTHWPCSYETAAEDVTKSAPVKVFLFRHLSYLQNAVRRSAHKEEVEEIIESMTSLYEYWNKTHGAFFGELLQNYSAVPQRIQGWFVCISAHWHLATLMVADLLDFIDENALGSEDATAKRIASQMAQRIRKQSTSELSDLARVGTPPTRYSYLGTPQMSDFHHAINEGTLLTEPWTMILIRAFTKACLISLDEAKKSLQTHLGSSSHDFEQHMEHAEYCMKGLWFLGKKSDMAREIAETLSLALVQLSPR